ncbi:MULTISPECIES: HU family DNA-binding protein [Lactococcus]|uniref:HU family DNA-binding protein n=1 Tax=Lactococcus TaxID=1357 RepID=UPI000474DC09|nr:HU family DNA-binding protein [Lactococcus garvieae]
MTSKTELVKAMATKTGMTQTDTDKAVKAFVEAITEFLSKGESVQMVGFGTFETRERAAREGRNPQTGDKIKIAAATVPAFKAGKALKDAVK